jgi:hypothetical protein
MRRCWLRAWPPRVGHGGDMGFGYRMGMARQEAVMSERQQRKLIQRDGVLNWRDGPPRGYWSLCHKG